MELRTASSPRDVKTYDTQRLREEFLIDDLFRADDIKLVYSHIDRIITGSAVPVKGTPVWRWRRARSCARSIFWSGASWASSTSAAKAR